MYLTTFIRTLMPSQCSCHSCCWKTSLPQSSYKESKMKKVFQYLKKGSKGHTGPHHKARNINKSEEAYRITDIELGGLIGFGNFNYICIGYIKYEPTNVLKSVAVKIPREGNSGKLDMDNEVSLMRKIGHHEFVLGIIDTVESDTLPDGTFIITDLCVNGSLKNYLGRLSLLDENQSECVETLRDVPVRIYESVKFAYQIASGMEYISSKNIVHGDLAARNVLLDERKNCKISDFGLSVEMGTAMEMGDSREGIGIPWRWVAPECFDSVEYSPRSDVWSYGVTVWEIFSLGACPYGDSKWRREFQQGIRNGSIRLLQPDLADDSFYGLMTACWQIDITSRPTFSNIVKTLQTKYLQQREELGADKIKEIDYIQPSRMAEMGGPKSTSKSTVNFEIPLKEWKFGTTRGPYYYEAPPLPGAGQGSDEYSGMYASSEKSTATIFGRRVHVLTNDDVDLKMVLNEIKILRHIGFHLHIVEFVATFTGGIRHGKAYLATELCEKGSLLKYLRKNKPRFEENSAQEDTLKELWRFSPEVALALEYLAKKNVVHGSVGTRNVLLDANGNCKLHNFTFSCILRDYETQISKERNDLELKETWRWRSPESTYGLTFSYMSDVWSYGVTIWEIYSLGAIPFEGVNWSEDRMNEVKEGLRLERPAIAPQVIYDKLLECWNINPYGRPSFEELVKFFADGVRGDYYLKIYECMVPEGESGFDAEIQIADC